MRRTLRELFLICFVLFLAPFWGALKLYADDTLKVVFINPGASDPNHPTGGFWRQVSDCMQSAALDLNIDIEIFYAERQIAPMIDFTSKLVLRAKKPDYVIIVNEKLVASKLLPMLMAAHINTLIAFNDLSSDQVIDLGTPRQKFEKFIGSVIPDNFAAGAIIAEELLKAGKERKGAQFMIAINGDRSTPAALEREAGLGSQLKKVGKDIVLRQVIYGDWSEAKAHDAMKIIYHRYPKIDMIWAANDPMAMGAIRLFKETYKDHKELPLIAGLNWSTEAIESIKRHEMVASVGGHFLTGALALVMLYDHHSGKDFAKDGSFQRKFPLFGVINRTNIASIRILEPKYIDSIDFKEFTKTHNKNIQDYSFTSLLSM